MNEEIERMNDEIIELREDNQRLHSMSVIIEQINAILSSVVSQCKCVSNRVLDSKTKTKLNILNNKYKQLKESENYFTFIDNNYSKPQTVGKTSAKVCPKLVIKKSFNESNDCLNQNEDNDNENGNQSSDKHNYFVSIEGIDETFYRESGEEVKLEFVLPQIDNLLNPIELQSEELMDSNKTLNVRNSKPKANRKKSSFDKYVNKSKTKVKNNIKCNKSIKSKAKVRPRRKVIVCSWPGCDLSFRDKYNLSVHSVRHTGEKSFHCVWPQCAKTYATKAALDVHHNSHSDNRRFKCPYEHCMEAFIRKTQLTVHISDKHTGNRQYKCLWPGCEYQSCYLNRLQAHKMRHTNERPYKCSWPDCEWSFRLNHHLKSHMLKHTGEKPYVCGSCDKRFQSKQAMKIHSERAHSDH